FKIISGYKGSSGIFHAIETGEVHGALASNVSWMTIKPGWVEDRFVVPIFSLGRKATKGFEGVALIENITINPEHRLMLHAAGTGAVMGRSMAAVTDITADRLRYLSGAFRKGMHDPEVLALEERLKLPDDYTSGEELDRLTK